MQHSDYTIIHFMKCSPNISSTQLAPHIVITILSTVFPTLHFPFPWLFCQTSFLVILFIVSECVLGFFLLKVWTTDGMLTSCTCVSSSSPHDVTRVRCLGSCLCEALRASRWDKRNPLGFPAVSSSACVPFLAGSAVQMWRYLYTFFNTFRCF